MNDTLPTRRPCVTQTIDWQGESYHITMGYYPGSPEIAEIWAYGPRAGSDNWALVQDVCRDFSLQLQAGRDPHDIAARAIRDQDGAPMSLFGVLGDVLVLESMETNGKI